MINYFWDKIGYIFIYIDQHVSFLQLFLSSINISSIINIYTLGSYCIIDEPSGVRTPLKTLLGLPHIHGRIGSLSSCVD